MLPFSLVVQLRLNKLSLSIFLPTQNYNIRNMRECFTYDEHVFE